MITLTAEEAGRALGLAPLASPVVGVSIDSRTISPGDLFIALRGEQFDGHDFVAAAFAAGASGAVVEKRAWAERRSRGLQRPGAAGPEDAGAQAQGAVTGPIYEVDDTVKALGALAREVRRRSRATVFAVTGSVGKTSTKDLLKAMVGRVRRVAATAANQNNEVGVSLTLLAVEPDTEAIIVEMGMRGRGQIAALARVAEPDVGVITNIHPVHLELLGTLEDIAEAKAELIAGLKPDGVAVVPCECGLLSPYTAIAGRRVLSFGVGAEAQGADVVGAQELEEGEAGTVLSVHWPGGKASIETQYLPRYGVENAVAAAAACYAAGLPLAECVMGIRDVQFTGGRGDIMKLAGLCVIDDTYNANPAAMRAALDHLVRVAAEMGGRPVAVLGDMLELGPQSTRFHEETGVYAASAGVRALWGVGSRARSLVKGFRAAWEAKAGKGPDWTAGHVASAEETSPVVASLLPGDVVLFKASRSMKLETMLIKVVDQAEAGKWASATSPMAGDGDGMGETLRC